MSKNLVIIAKIMIVIFCSAGIVHELIQVISYNEAFLRKSKISVGYFLSLFIFALLYQKTNLFNKAMININSNIFLILVFLFLCMEVLMYAVLFASAPPNSKIHSFAPFNFLIIFWLWLITLITLFGISHLGVINKLKT